MISKIKINGYIMTVHQSKMMSVHRVLSAVPKKRNEDTAKRQTQEKYPLAAHKEEGTH